MTVVVEHPSGRTECVVERDADGAVTSAGMLRTARKLMDGVVFG
jgi:4-oxalomesaconate tautomerase